MYSKMEITCFRLALTWITLLAVLEVVFSSTVCPGKPNFVTSSTNYTYANISRYFSGGQHTCAWVIERNDCGGKGIEVTLTNLALHSSDTITIYDGPSEGYPVLATYAQRRNNYYRHSSSFGPKQSSGRFATVVVLIRSSYNNRRFHLRYRDAVSGLGVPLSTNRSNENEVSDRCGDELLLAYSTLNSITSPGYPREYGNSLDCKWKIVSDDVCNDDVIQVNIHALSLEDTYDHLVFYDGETELSPVLRKLSGNKKQEVIIASGQSMLIEFKTDDTAPGRGFHLTYFRTIATPSISDPVTTKVTKNMAEMVADFMSTTPHSVVFFSKDGGIIQQDVRHTLAVTKAKVSIESEPGVKVDGFRASLVITDPTSQDFGVYKVAVKNAFGVSESVVFLKSGYSVPVIENYTVFSGNATIMVKFSSDQNFKVEWYRAQKLLTAGHDLIMSTEVYQSEDENKFTYAANLIGASPIEPVYGDYKCVIRNDVGAAEIYIHLGFPDTELPKLLITPSSVEMNDDVMTMSVNFDSNIAYPTATWYHGNAQIEASEKYRLALNRNGINSSDWLSSGYPISESLANVSDTYQYPFLGGDRTSTHPNANYTATLTISRFTSEHFGSYLVVLENSAGKANHLIDVTSPEVFPYATCNQGGTIQLACNVTSCSDVSLSWIHSVGDVVIRKLSGNQDEAINTLTIPVCMYADAGTYTCVGTDQETGSDVVINHDKTTLAVGSVPVLMEPTVAIQADLILIEVPFYAEDVRRITWYRNGERISPSGRDVIDTDPSYVNVSIHGIIKRLSGHMTSIRVFSPTVERFGIYKVTITNDMGSSELNIDAGNPEYASPVTSSDIRVTYDGSSALLSMIFTSYFPQSSVKWYFKGIEVREHHPANKYVIQTNSSNQVHDSDQSLRTKVTMSSTLTVTCLTEEDYGIYDAVVSNQAGKTVVPVRLAESGLGVPQLVSELVINKTHSMAEISASFHTPSGYREISWLKGGMALNNSSAKYHIVNEVVDMEIFTDGETVETTGVITRLDVTSLTDQDYGLYTVQIYNEFGMTDNSIMLDKECT